MPKIRSLVAGTAAVAAVVAVTAAAPSAGAGVPAQTGDAVAATEVLRAIGLTQNGRLVRFNTNNPSRSESIGFVSGLNAGTRLIGIDYRVQDNKLYGVGDDGAVYTIRVRSATATQVSQLTVPLDGTQFGVDFNPAADRLRIVSNTGQNLRHDVNLDVTTVDVTLSYPPDIPVAVGVTAVAYTNTNCFWKRCSNMDRRHHQYF